MSKISYVLVKDIVERVLVTFLEAWIGAWLLVEDHELGQLFDKTILGVGVAAAVLALAKSLGASQVNEPDSASLAPEV